MKTRTQPLDGFGKLKELAAATPVQKQGTDIDLISRVADNDGHLNYIAPILEMLRNNDSLIEIHGEYRYNEILATLLSFIGDYRNAEELLHGMNIPGYPPQKVQLSSRYQQILAGMQYVDLFPFILKHAATSKVLMVNEAHHRPQHRMTMLTLLDSLYKLGYRTLAAESLTNSGTHTEPSFPPTSKLGFYAVEPLLSELFRHAASLGYRLVPYEQLVSQFGDVSRDSVQASNLLSDVQVNDTNKLLVFAGYGHIDEPGSDGDGYMAYYFKKLSSIDPFTLDQTTLSYGNGNSIPQVFYDTLAIKYNIQKPMVPIINYKPYSMLGRTDATVVLPRPKYLNGRPNWLYNWNQKRETKVIPPKKFNNKLFLLQAYYKKELQHTAMAKLIPADQTYDHGFAYYSLFLFPGTFQIVGRDISNNILFTKEIKVVE